MNERIKELYKQARQIPGHEGAVDEPYMSDHELRFAELIVQECISQIEKQGNGLTSTEWDEGYRAGLNASQKATKKHFGVEE